MTTITTEGGFIRVQGTEADVCRLIAQRQQFGLVKYQTSLRDNPLSLREWLVHQQQELADALLYCTRALEELDKQTDDFK